MRLWGGRFGDESDAGDADGDRDERIAAFGRSIEIDREMAVDDLDGSVAHVRGLGRAGILTDDEVATLLAGLADLRRDVEAGELRWDPALEDVHLNLEAALTERVGPVAGKLHTGRSRNDQVATDLRLWT
ncbi:MAG TPA: lyase family protein, partial [Candidatus Limnocylindrales bacterium]